MQCILSVPFVAHASYASTLQVRLRLLPLDLVQKVKVWLVKVVDTHVSVLTTTAVAGALRVYSDVVERSEVATDTANLLHEDLVVEAGFEFTLACGGGGDVHGGLSSTEDNVVFYGGDGGAVEGCVGDVRFENIELFDIDKLEELALRPAGVWTRVLPLRSYLLML